MNHIYKVIWSRV
ncbi:MAG TPA: hypothetical protein DD378_00540, partial [Dialister sp.]|nr:hypothetical protein [Dialister sp.]